MTLDEAIKHCKEVANGRNGCSDCKNEHLQLAKWLSELKRRKSNTITIEDFYQWAQKNGCTDYDITIECYDAEGDRQKIWILDDSYLNKRNDDVLFKCCE